jgi:hypothetical protein
LIKNIIIFHFSSEVSWENPRSVNTLRDSCVFAQPEFQNEEAFGKEVFRLRLSIAMLASVVIYSALRNNLNSWRI